MLLELPPTKHTFLSLFPSLPRLPGPEEMCVIQRVYVFVCVCLCVILSATGSPSLLFKLSASEAIWQALGGYWMGSNSPSEEKHQLHQLHLLYCRFLGPLSSGFPPLVCSASITVYACPCEHPAFTAAAASPLKRVQPGPEKKGEAAP